MVTARTFTPAQEQHDLLGAAAVTDRALLLSLHHPHGTPDPTAPATPGLLLDGRIDVGLVVGDPVHDGDSLEVTYRRPGSQPGRRTLLLNGLGSDLANHFVRTLTTMRARRERDIARIREAVGSMLPPDDEIYLGVAVNSSMPARGVNAPGEMVEAYVALSHRLMFASPFTPTDDRPGVAIDRELVGCWASPAEGGFRVVVDWNGGDVTRLIVPTDPADWWLLQDFCDELETDG